MTGPLSGVRVLDLTRILAGPWASQNLADLGADVIKIERPDKGDDTRAFGPPFIHDQTTGEALHASYFLSCNRNKRSVAVDIARPGGADLVRQLARQSDIVIENFKVGDLARYGLDYASLSPTMPELIYCSLTGFGQTGPYAQRPGYDYLIQAMGGMMSVTGERDDLPGGGPQRAGIAISDLMSGMYAALAIVAALHHRDAGGGGQHIDISMLDVQVGTLVNQGLNFLTTGEAPGRVGNGHPNLAPYRVFATLDGHVVIAVGNDEQFTRLCEVIGRVEWATDTRFATNASRVSNTRALAECLAPLLRERSTNEWIAALERARVPCGPINTIDRVFADPHVQARGMRLEMKHRRSGTIPAIANPMRFSKSPVDYTLAPPMLGEHTAFILEDRLRLSGDEIASLAQSGIVSLGDQ